jgi:hypothetical protein
MIKSKNTNEIILGERVLLKVIAHILYYDHAYSIGMGCVIIIKSEKREQKFD